MKYIYILLTIGFVNSSYAQVSTNEVNKALSDLRASDQKTDIQRQCDGAIAHLPEKYGNQQFVCQKGEPLNTSRAFPNPNATFVLSSTSTICFVDYQPWAGAGSSPYGFGGCTSR